MAAYPPFGEPAVGGPATGESSNALCDQASPELAPLVRGSSRRIMIMPAPPGRSANNRVIHRRSCPRPPPRGLRYLTGSFHNRAFLRQERAGMRHDSCEFGLPPAFRTKGYETY